jgi:poly-gamma-glutamate capsule biosynthesis protein CapA/YwtB (metallophosphatase superfamily)
VINHPVILSEVQRSEESKQFLMRLPGPVFHLFIIPPDKSLFLHPHLLIRVMKNYSLFIFLIFAFLMARCNNPEQKVAIKDPADSIKKVQAKVNDTIVIAGAGDIMMGTIIPSRASLPPKEDCSGELVPTSEYFKSANVAFCNLEGVFTDTPAGRKSCKNPKSCYTFGMPAKFVNCLVEAGFDLVSVANNHCKDFGEAGKVNTGKTLENAGLKYAGWLSKKTDIYEKDGLKYGFCAFSPESGNCDLRNYEEAKRIVKGLDSVCDIVIVSFHSGAEGKDHQHVPKADEMFMGYNRGNVYKFAHEVIDAGADVVFGHGPHVTRAVEVYKDRFIAYSMGNFNTYSNISVAGVCGLAPIMRVYTNNKGAFYKAQIISTFQTMHIPPQVDPAKKVLKIIQDLTKADFPGAKFIIDDNGWVTKTE